MITITLVPWLTFVGIGACFVLAYHHYRALVWAIVGSFLLLTAMAGAYGFLNEQRRNYLFVGVLSGVAVVLGTFVGFYDYNQLMVQYYGSVDGHSFIDVMPSDKAGAYRDAGKVLFTEESRVDATRSLGYKAGDMYCVAPIMDESEPGNIEFWAVGMNCCARRGFFSCDDAWNPAARGGMIIHDAEGFWKDRHDYYMAAIKQAEAAFDVSSAKLPLLVRWVQDPEKVETDFRDSGFILAGIAAAVHFVFACFCTNAVNNALTAG